MHAQSFPAEPRAARRASMHRFAQRYGRILVAGAAAGAIAMTAFISLTAHLLG